MEVDVHLTREGEEPWGFEIIGGADYAIPLTIDKYWTDKKSSAKKKGMLRSVARRRTGGGNERIAELSEVDERIISLMGGVGFFEGDRHLAIQPFHNEVEVTASSSVDASQAVIPPPVTETVHTDTQDVVLELIQDNRDTSHIESNATEITEQVASGQSQHLFDNAETSTRSSISNVYKSSPAEKGGLQPGDVVARLGDKLATELSQGAARDIVAEAVGSLSFGICRGLYDPVLDDYEPIYEPIERADSDLRSEPTEVQFPIQFDPNDLSLDDPNILDPRITNPSLWDSGYGPLTESRSLTASPFVPNTKPYRPFSTEPLEVPPLDDPIILNPSFKDTCNFKQELCNVKTLEPGEDELLRLLPLDKNIEARFKLPVSDKYDPEWDKKVKFMLEKCTEGGKRETRVVEPELVYFANKTKDLPQKEVEISKELKIKEDVKVGRSQTTKEEVKFEEKGRQKMDMQTIEQTAFELVDESIERAVSVTEEIKNEIEEELRGSVTRELEVKKTEATSQIKTMKERESFDKSEFTESIKQESKILEESKQETTKTTADEEIINVKLVKDQQFVEERRQSAEREMADMIETGNVKRKCSAFDKEERVSSTTNTEERKEFKDHRISQKELEETLSVGTVKRQSMAFNIAQDELVETRKDVKVSNAEDRKTGHVSELKSSGTFSTETLKSEGKQKAFMLGLQTIPHIKGFVQSSYHFDMLLRTFFVHLTDVMVALSRFILTQPSTELESKAEKVIKEKLIKEFGAQDTEQYVRRETAQKCEDKQQSMQFKQEENDSTENTKTVQSKQKTNEATKVYKNTQQVHNKELQEIHQVKYDIKKSDDTKMERDIIVTDHFSENQDTLDMHLEKVETVKKSGAEMAQRTQKKSKDLKNKMDAVITEFENKAGIEDRLEVTEQSKRRSRSRSHVEEEVMREGDPLEWLDKVDSARASQESTDLTFLKNEFSTFSESRESKKSEIKRESRSSKAKPGKQMYVAVVESHVYTNEDSILEDQIAEISETASVQSFEEINAASESIEAMSTEHVAMSSMIQNEEKQRAVEVINNALEEVVQEKQEILDTVSDYKSQMTEHHSKSVLHESYTTVAAESTEIFSESKVETFKAKEIKERNAVVLREETYKNALVECEDVPLEATEEISIKSKAAKQKAVAKVESLAIAVAESTDVVVDDSKLETFESKGLVSKKAKVASEETFKTAAVGTSEVAFEVAEEKHTELTKTSQATVKESQHLAVAGIIETKTEVCKEPKKPAEDEYASLKIIKEDVINGGESVEILSESEVNVKKSIDIEMSSSHHIQSSTKESYQSISQESSISKESHQSSAKSKLDIRTDIAQQGFQRQASDQSDENNNTPTPSIPPTPLTDEYVFRLAIPLPKNEGTVMVEESPDREDPHIVKKGLVPHIESTIEEQIIYDPPLPTPAVSPVYTKPGLRGGAAPLFKKEYIREIERKSSLLASAIDQTIKSIEEYKEEVGIDTNEVTIKLKKKTAKTHEEKLTNGFNHTNGLSNGHEEIGFENESESKMKKEWAEVETQVAENNVRIQQLSKEKSNDNVERETARENGTEDREKESDAPPGFKPVVFNPEAFQARLYEEVIRGTDAEPEQGKPYLNESGEPLGTVQGIIDGLEDATVDEKAAKELGKPGLTEEKIAVLISGESEMLREAHVMGLSRVITSHMTRPDDSSVDFQKIKPLVPSLNDSEVLKVLNEELVLEKTKKEKEEKKWTTFLQKPKRPVPRAKFGYCGYVDLEEIEAEEPYKVKIVKQPKPKVAPDYKPKDFDTGPLPWEERALTEPVPSPVPPEDPILVPEESPEFLEAVDPLPESEVPDLEDTGIPLPPSPPPTPPPEETPPSPEPQEPPPDPQPPEQVVEEPPPKMQDLDQNQMAEQLVNSVKSMVDPHAPLEQQLCQMRSQLAALARLPHVIQHSLELLTKQLTVMTQRETHQMSCEAQKNMENHHQIQENTMEPIPEYQEQEVQNDQEGTQKQEDNAVTIEDVSEDTVTQEEIAAKKREEEAMIEEQRRIEKEKKERQEITRLDQESRQVKQRAPRVGKPKPVFGPPSPEDRPLVLPGGRRWRGPKDAYNDQMIAETLQAQSEILQGKVMGYESDRLPYDNRINFMKYEKPPVSLDHLQNSATYKLIHNMEREPMKRVDLLTPVVAESDYRERCRSATPNVQMNGRM